MESGGGGRGDVLRRSFRFGYNYGGMTTASKLAHIGSAASAFLIRYGAPIALAAFALAGVAALDDYGAAWDTRSQRYIGQASLDYVLGDSDALYEDDFEVRFYGVAFEMPLAAVERVLGLDDTRAIHLIRHLLTHLLFLAGGFSCWLLTYRLFGSRALALFAMLLFLLHPRIYAHSFINSKDAPFLSVFMIALYLIHRAFRRDTVLAFALCGAGVGLLASVRLMGAALFPAAAAMLALDFLRAARGGDGGGAKRVLANGAAFAAAAALALYGTFPYLWTNPLGLFEGISTLSRYPVVVGGLFEGEWVSYPNIPWRYTPTWMLITTPPIALALALAGAVFVIRKCAANPPDAIRNGSARFGLLIIAALTLPILAAAVLNSNLYDGWRQMYFLYAPLCLLAAFGLRWATTSGRRWARAGAYALTAAGLVFTVAEMVQLHPYQNDYFNFLADRGAPERLNERYTMDYFGNSRRAALECLLARYPDDEMILVADANPAANRALDINRHILPAADRARIFDNPRFAEFVINGRGGAQVADCAVRIYGSAILTVEDRRAEMLEVYRETHKSAAAGEPVIESVFDVYMDGEALTYVKDPCGAEDTRARFFLSVIPESAADLPDGFRALGHESLNFDFGRRGTIFDGKCLARRALPGYPVSAIETGQRVGERNLWVGVGYSDAAGRADAYRAAYRSSRFLEPVAKSGFDVYADGGGLTYVKEGCSDADARGRFLLSVFPKSRADLPQEFRDLGHESLNFDFARYGARFDGVCVATRTLPAYPIASIETGQWIPNGGRLWSVEIAVGD